MNEEKGQKRKTVGQVSSEMMLKAALNPSNTDSNLQTDAHLTDYEQNIVECAQKFSERNLKTSFFVVVLTKREKLLKNVMRNYFFARFSCPTPDYDQAVFHYDYETEDINLLWIVPDRQSCFHLKENILNNPPDLKELVQYVLDFADGTLFKKALALNNEKSALNPILEIVEGTPT